MKHPDLQGFDAEEQEEWLDALDGVLKRRVCAAACFVAKFGGALTRTGASLPFAVSTPYRNTIPSADETPMPGDLFMERRIRSLIRWNALASVVRANRRRVIWVDTSPVSALPPRFMMLASTTFSGAEPVVALWRRHRSGDLTIFRAMRLRYYASSS